MSIVTNPTRFDGNLLTDIPGLTVLSVNSYVPAKRTLAMSALARSNSAKVTSGFYTSRPIIVHIGITRSTRDLLEASIDQLMAIIQGIEKELLVPQGGGIRKYTATAVPTNISRDGGSYIEMDLQFETSDHFGYDYTPTQLAQINGFTSGQKTTQITVGGSAAWQVPIITVTYTSISTGTSKEVRIGNDATGAQIAITRTWVSGDVLEIDSQARTVKVNGVEVEFTGALPEWAPGTGYMAYSDTFTARTFGLKMVYYKRYV